MNIGIIITGIIQEDYLDELIEMYNDCNYMKIISTWNYTDENMIVKLRKNGFIVIQNDFPEELYKNSSNYQIFSTKKGIEYAEQHNITHVIRLRADMNCNNINKLLEIYQQIYEENKMIFLLHIHNDPPGYLIDYAHFGNISDTKQYICHFQEANDPRYPEKFRQEECYKTSDIHIINQLVTYSGQHLINNNIDFRFTKQEYRHDQNLIQSYIDYNNKNHFTSF